MRGPAFRLGHLEILYSQRGLHLERSRRDPAYLPIDRSWEGSAWVRVDQNVDLTPADVLTDIAACKLRNISWVIPTGAIPIMPSPTTAEGRRG